MSILETRQASVRRGGRTIFGPASIQINVGEFTALIGPNGSGKSTLLRLFAGLWRPNTGDILLDGTAIHTRPRKDIARQIAFVPQETQIDFAFTVTEILSMGRYARRGRFAPETQADHAAVNAAAADCDVTHLLERTVNSLSGGERQRVLIARSLVGEPNLILLDEPTANLDIQHALEVLHLCQKLSRQGKTVVIATHDFNLVMRYVSRLVLLRAGMLVAQGSREEVLRPATIQEVFNVDAELVPTRAGDPLYVFHSHSAE